MNIQPGDKLAWITGYGNGIDGLFVTVQRRVIPGETVVLSTGRELTLREDRTADHHWHHCSHTDANDGQHRARHDHHPTHGRSLFAAGAWQSC